MVSPITFLNQTWDELRKVIWPTQQEVIRLTVVVLIISVIVGLFVGGLDYLFTNIVTTLINR